MRKPFSKEKDLREHRLPVLLTTAEYELVKQHLENNRDKFSSISDMIREFIKKGLQVTISRKS